MARIYYDKLVRDNIPDIIRADGRQCEVTTLDDDQYRAALLSKLLEESRELAEATPAEAPKELADLLEVVSALIEDCGLGEKDVREVQTLRRAERGGFTKRMKLVWVE